MEWAIHHTRDRSPAVGFWFPNCSKEQVGTRAQSSNKPRKKGSIPGDDRANVSRRNRANGAGAGERAGCRFANSSFPGTHRGKMLPNSESPWDGAGAPEVQGENRPRTVLRSSTSWRLMPAGDRPRTVLAPNSDMIQNHKIETRRRPEGGRREGKLDAMNMLHDGNGKAGCGPSPARVGQGTGMQTHSDIVLLNVVLDHLTAGDSPTAFTTWASPRIPVTAACMPVLVLSVLLDGIQNFTSSSLHHHH